MKLFHGSRESKAPIIKVDISPFCDSSNIFDGLFASDYSEIAGSHGPFVHTYNVESVADNSVLNERIDEVIAFLRKELCIDDSDNSEDVEALADAIADDKCDDSFAYMLYPRSCSGFDYADASWEMQRLRGRVAAHLGFDAIKMNDEHGTSYIIVNPKIIAE